MTQLRPLTIALVLRTIRTDRDAAYCRHTPSNSVVTPREVFFPSQGIWVRCNGSYVTAALRGDMSPGLLHRWRIRRAFRHRQYSIRGLL